MPRHTPFARPRRAVTLVLTAVLALAVIAGTTAVLMLHKTVTLSLDGESRSVRGFARTVGAVLESEGIRVGEHDIVAPAPGTPLREGARVVVRFGRQVTLNVDGRARTLWTTARTVEEALRQLGVRADGAYVSVSRSNPIGRSGLSLAVRLPRRLTVVADGRRLTRSTTVRTVREALAEAGVPVRPTDRVSVGLNAYPVDGQVVTINRVDTKLASRRLAVAFRTVRRSDPSAYAGTTDVSAPGRTGVRVQTFRLTYVDGRLSTRRLVSDRVTKAPVTRVVAVGTKARPKPAPRPSTRRSTAASTASPTRTSTRGSGGLNWAALARCESGGNPRAYNPAGPYYGLYQFSLGTWRSVGGSGTPSSASASEQTYRAQLLYQRAGRSPWPVCGRYL